MKNNKGSKMNDFCSYVTTLTSGGKRMFAVILSIALLLTFAAPALPSATTARADDDAVVSMPDPDNIFFYYTSYLDSRMDVVYVPTVYIMASRDDLGATYYVRDGNNANFLGQADVDPTGTSCVITLSAKPSKTTLDVRRSVNGVMSNWQTVTIVNDTVNMPKVEMNVYKVNTNNSLSISNTAAARASSTAISGNGDKIEKGSFYEVEVTLKNFTALNFVTVPFHYDTGYLRPAQVKSSKVSQISDESLNKIKSEKGTVFSVATSRTSIQDSAYGVVTGVAFRAWKGTEYAQFTPIPLDPADTSYQYMNGTTGLIKLQASIDKPMPFGTTTTYGYQFVRLYFEALEDLTLSDDLKIGDLIHFATEDDCPEEYKDTDSAVYWYDLSSPYGISPSLFGANVLASPPTALTTATSTKRLQLAASDFKTLSYSYDTALSDSSGKKLLQDEVKVNNYSNYGDYILDPWEEDTLELESSSNLKLGDVLKVYKLKSDNSGYDFLAEAEYTTLGISMSLGKNKLDPEGGTLYLSTARYNSNSGLWAESAKVPITYAAESSRKVTFEVTRSSWPSTHEPIYYTSSNEPDYNVLKDERLQLKIYFNDINDLMSYGFALHFDNNIIKVADLNYEVMPSGTVIEALSEDAESKTPFTAGEDMAYSASLTEQIFYDAYMVYENSGKTWDDEDPIWDLADDYGLEFVDIIAIGQAVEEKYARDPAWQGGLMYTGEREGSEVTTFPYVDNENGFIQFIEASLEPSDELKRDEGYGYHFLTINFVAVNAGNPALRLVSDSDSNTLYNSGTLPSGRRVLISSGKAVGIFSQWFMAPMPSTQIVLEKGNAHSMDPDENDIYIYNNKSFTEPGYQVALPDGTFLPNPVGKVNIEFVHILADGSESEPDAPYTDGAETALTISDSGVGEGYYDQYKIKYSYEYSNSGETITATAERSIYVLHIPGDINRDGVVDIFDEQDYANHINGVKPLDEALTKHSIFKLKTVDLTRDGTIDNDDREVIRRSNLGVSEILQDYNMD